MGRQKQTPNRCVLQLERRKECTLNSLSVLGRIAFSLARSAVLGEKEERLGVKL